MIVLAADTSLSILSVAIVEGDSILGALSLEGKGSRNEKVLPAIDWLLTENGVERTRIDLFAVTRGPGSFTGVRIGLATMQGLALALGRPVCAMSTHEAAAHGTTGRLVVMDDAGRGQYYVSSFDDGVEVTPPRLADAAELEELTSGASVIALGEFQQSGSVALGCARRAAAIERQGFGARYRDVTPIYVRLAEAEVKLNRPHA